MKTMYVFNTLSRKKEPLVPVHEGKVGIYACGPTVYNFFHIGNARPFVIFDTLRRFLVHLGYDVKFVQNFTDIDDKMIRRANEENTTVEAIAEKYIEEYFKDAAALGVKPADVHPRATKHIGEIIGLIKKLEAKGLAYAVDNGDVYFDTQAYRSNYGKLIGQDLDDLESGARIEVGDIKRHPMDFALWKGLPVAPSDWAISFSWWGKIRSTPPQWISKVSPRYFMLMAEHSMCQPGRPMPQGLFHAGSPGFWPFHRAKSMGWRLMSPTSMRAPDSRSSRSWPISLP